LYLSLGSFLIDPFTLIFTIVLVDSSACDRVLIVIGEMIPRGIWMESSAWSIRFNGKMIIHQTHERGLHPTILKGAAKSIVPMQLGDTS